MANNRFITTRSNYTIKEPHKKVGDSTIYERDYMTTTNLGGFDSGTIPYGEGNFKIITTSNNNQKRRHKSGEWLTKNDCELTPTNAETCITWTLNDLGEETKKESSENKIIPKQGYKDLLDFVYFGSCVELLKVSINNIILKYPAELFFTDKKFAYIKDGKDLTMGYVNFDNPFVLENPFNIDMISETRGVEQKNENYNPLRYFYESYIEYMLLNEDDEEIGCLTGWDVSVKKNKYCYVNGDLIATIDLKFSNFDNTLTLYAYFFDNKIVYIYDGDFTPKLINYKIRPRKSVINKIFGEDFSEFENFLLNQNSTPKYTINIKTPSETNRGIVYSMRSYTWPITNKWNLDISSPTYNRYVTSLIEVATFYDENRTDNLWKNMIHDSIKNLDVSMNTLKKIDEDVDDYIVGTGNIRGLMLAYGKQFDDLKLAIDNIKRGNCVTYDENNNLPNYFLSDTLNLSGWEVSSIVDTFNEYTTFNTNYSGENKKYDTNSINTHFLRMLKINSRAIFSRKGTRNGIEMLLSLFGLCSYEFGKNRYNALPSNKQVLVNGKNIAWESLSEAVKSEYYDYKLDEYVVVASNSGETEMTTLDKELNVEYYNTLKKDAASEFNLGGVSGLPARIVNVSYVEDKKVKLDGSEYGGEQIVTYKYIVPWFKKGIEYDGGLYFQMYGGWCKNENNDYEETKQYLRVVSKIFDLLKIPYSELNNNTLIYVNDIDDISNYIKTASSENASHYFNINNRDYSNLFTDNQNGDGWFNIPQSDIDEEIRLGIKVAKLEKIIETSIGNNPHVGYGIYDSGEEYLNYFRQLFKGAIDGNEFTDLAYDCETGLILPDIENTGFKLNSVVDNMKCWFFTDTTNDDNIYRLNRKYINAEDNYGATFVDLPFGYEETTYTTNVNVGKRANRNEVFFSNDLEAYNFEDGSFGGNDEAVANSIINVKKITLEFNREKYGDNSEFNKFLHKAILPYLKQMIPSTTIMEIIDINQGVTITDC